MAQRKYSIDVINNKMAVGSRLTAISIAEPLKWKYGQVYRRVLCRCVCGKEVIVRVANIISGVTKSCGCLAIELTIKRSKKYSHTIPTIRNAWHAMMSRCYNKTNTFYKDYGGKGVKICEEWHDYQIFLDWCLANGWAPGLQLDKDILGDGLLYSPNTCKWATRMENANHTSRNKKFQHNGQLLSVSEIARLHGFEPKLIYKRMMRGATIDEAVIKPKRRCTVAKQLK